MDYYLEDCLNLCFLYGPKQGIHYFWQFLILRKVQAFKLFLKEILIETNSKPKEKLAPRLPQKKRGPQFSTMPTNLLKTSGQLMDYYLGKLPGPLFFILA